MPEDIKKDRSRRLISHKNEVRDARLSDVIEQGEELLCIAESLDADGRVAMHSESFIEVKSLEKLSECEFSLMCGKWLKMKPLSHRDGILYCEFI